MRTGHLERIRRAVNDVVSQLGSASKKRKGRARKSKGGRKRKSGGKRRKCGSSKKSYKERRTDSAMLDNVRAALGIAAPATHWSEVQSSGSFSLFGSAAAFDPMGSEGEDDEEDAPGPGPGTRVMPRHLAVERLALARRRRNKVEAMLVHCQTCHAVQVGHHAGQSSRLTRFLGFFNSPVHQGACVVVVESYVSVLVTSYRQRQSRVGEHCVDWTHRL